MSYLQHRRHDSSQDIDTDGISFSDLRSSNTSYKAVSGTGYEELDLGDERSSLRPIIDRKPIQSASPTFAPAHPVNHDFLKSAPARPLPQKHFRRTAICLLLGMLSVPFYVFCGFAWHYHDRPVASKNQSISLNSFGNKLATAFPFVFSLVVGHTVRQVGSWKLERGTSLRSLEQIMGSLALGSTIITQVLLRRPNILALLLLATWALSPIGSQSSLQILTVGVHPTMSNLTIPYFNTESLPGFSEGDFWNGPSLNALFASSLMAPASIRNSSMDLWGNVKVPDFSRLTSSANSTGWTNVPVPVPNATYSSVLGIPLGNLPKQGNTTFSIETSYIALDCYNNITATEEFYNYTEIGSHNGTMPNGTFYAVIGPSTGSSDNSSTFSGDFMRTFSLAINGFYDDGVYGSVLESINDTRIYEPWTILYQTKYGGVSAWCPITTKYVESAVECAGTDCSVVAIRPSQLKHPNANLTNLGFMGAFDAFCGYIMMASAAQLHDGTSSALELYIGDPDSAPQAGLAYTNITGISASDLGIRLQQVINTYWFGSYDPVSMMGFLNLNQSDDKFTNLTLNATARNIVYNEVYVMHFGWFFALLLATTTMLAAALVGAFFSWQIKGPEILGHTSTLLRDTPYVGGVKAGTTMDGLERTRREGHMRVKLLDVDPNNEVGYIAVAEDIGRPGGGLIRGRYYR
ncbi:hypothetical protein N431DRAFT_374078 [Stipitochalara longipes BDJ]|nr:hypothetical protein N431DRAFT_374078 [Stipitochalara longipes BDJ]